MTQVHLSTGGVVGRLRENEPIQLAKVRKFLNLGALGSVLALQMILRAFVAHHPCPGLSSLRPLLTGLYFDSVNGSFV